ncbi:OLC1v1004391C2 [Oldenlandia corymbosa var. corymbosa]|nr:OLC1v1004391C2 [Oldenlandia corymbosa var. corymbosa]
MNLKKLTLRESIGKLPKLEVLKLVNVSLMECTWRMEEEEFNKLKILELNSYGLRFWSASDDQFECLEKLELQACKKLEEMPSCLESISMLQMIGAVSCSETVNELVKKIGQVQVDNGNSDLKINIQRY